MEMKVRCYRCNEDLEIKDTFAAAAQGMIIEVAPCPTKEHYDCSDCEDLAKLESDCNASEDECDNLREELSEEKANSSDLKNQLSILKENLEDAKNEIQELKQLGDQKS